MKEISVDEAIKQVKELLQSFHLNTFHKYREAGLEIIKAGYTKGKWRSKQKKRTISEWAVSRQTVDCMLQLGKLTETEFANAISKSPYVNLLMPWVSFHQFMLNVVFST